MTDEYTPVFQVVPSADTTSGYRVYPMSGYLEEPLQWWEALMVWIWDWVEKVWDKVTAGDSQ